MTEWNKKTKYSHAHGVMGENRGKLYAFGGPYNSQIEFYNRTRWSEVEGITYGYDNSVSISTPNGVYFANSNTIQRFDDDKFVTLGHVHHV